MSPRARLAVVALMLATPLTAGQSLVIPVTQPIGVSDSGFPHNQSWRVEFQIHDWRLPPAGAAPIITLYSVGFEAFLQSNGQMYVQSLGDSIVELQPCYLNLSGLTNALVRFQRNLTAKTVTCEIWNYDSTGYNSQTDHINVPGNLPFGGGSLGGGGASASLGFLRVFTTLVPQRHKRERARRHRNGDLRGNAEPGASGSSENNGGSILVQLDFSAGRIPGATGRFRQLFAV
jgi:hypothetical protein